MVRLFLKAFIYYLQMRLSCEFLQYKQYFYRTVSVKSTVKILSIFVAFLENMNFKSAVTDGQKTRAKEFKRISFLSRFCQFEYSRVGNVRKRLGIILRILLFLIASI